MSKLRKMRAKIIESKDRFIGIFKILKRLNALESNLESKIDFLNKKLNINLSLQNIHNQFLHTANIASQRINKNKFLLFDYSTHTLNGNFYNLGDYMQTIATHKALERIFGEQLLFEYFDRDSLSYYNSEDNEKIACVMQGYFAGGYNFLPSMDILPIYVGTHFCASAREFLLEILVRNPHYFDDVQIGCRDISTLEFCQNYGIKSYFSRCLTLTLPKRENLDSQNKIFLVNVPNEFMEYLPSEITQNAEIINQGWINLGQDSNWHDYHNETKMLLNRYKNEAKLIITDRLHVASPCSALGIPVIWIKHIKEQDMRFSALEGILKTYSLDDFKNAAVDFNPKTPNIEVLKSYMLENLKLSILQNFGEKIDTDYLQDIREKIAKFRCL